MRLSLFTPSSFCRYVDMFQADSGQGGYGEAGYEAQIKTSGAKEKLLAHLEPSVLAEVRTQKRKEKRSEKRSGEKR